MPPAAKQIVNSIAEMHADFADLIENYKYGQP